MFSDIFYLKIEIVVINQPIVKLFHAHENYNIIISSDENSSIIYSLYKLTY